MSPTTVAEVLTRMRDIASDLPASDGARVFNGVYLKVTERMRDRLNTSGVFRDNAFVADLDVHFADYWFNAYDAPGAKPKAWDPLFTARANSQILPIQFALAGINTHIENDLPLAVVATCTARGRAPDSPGVHEDYDTVNDVLASVEAGIRRSFLTEVEKSIDNHFEPVSHLICSWDIEKARDCAWLTAQTLWELRRAKPVFDAFVETLGSTVGMGSRLLLTPVMR